MIINAHSQRLNVWRFLIDMTAVLTAWIAAYAVRFDAGLIAMPKGDAPLSRYLALVPTLILAYALTFMATGVYRRTVQKRRIWMEHFDVIRTSAMAFVAFVTLTYFIFDHRYSRATLVLFFLLCPLAIAVGRSLVRKANRSWLRNKIPGIKAIVVGSGQMANAVAALVAERREWGLALTRHFRGDEALEVKSYLQSDSVGVVFIAASVAEAPQMQAIYDSLGTTVAEVFVVPDFNVPTFLKPQMLQLDDLVAVALNISPLDSAGRIQKRLFDIAFSLAFILLFSPVFLLCALLVRLSSPGPVLYRQERMGLDGQVFECLKFRGMRVDAETTSGPVWAKANDNRVTPIGKVLRKTSLDEIPQFFNVLMGDMSVVGPRPERPFFVDKFRHEIPGYMLRHKAKAGITGWAQVNGWRGDTSLEKRIECDLWYLQNWSIWLDLKIALLTPFKGLIHPNAY